jgi:predicted nucleic acid-binding protein
VNSVLARLVVPDSSVIIKWFRAGEPLRDHALALQSQYLDGRIDLAIPDLLLYEIANVLRYKPDLSVDDVCAAMQSLYDMNMAVIPASAEASLQAVRIARRHEVTVYDATFLACAQRLSASLVTADEAFMRKTQGDSTVVYLATVPLTPELEM